MITDKLNGYLILEHLSNIELYYTSPELTNEDEIILRDEEFHHCVNVMRNSEGDTLYVTDGQGKIITTTIQKIENSQLKSKILTERKYEDKVKNIWFCIPSLKNPDRLKFAFEKCVELGITNFILFSSNHSINKKLKPEKFRKTTLSAMKQSLRAYLPGITVLSLNEIANNKGMKILMDQNAERVFDGKINLSESVYFIFGPEGGFDESEINLFEKINTYSLSAHRLRSETAIVKCASVLNLP